jgi:hypothetical protein
MTIRDQAKILDPILPVINHYNDKPLCGEIKLVDKFKWIHFRQEFSTRLMRKTLNDFLSNTYSDKINNRGWVISIIIY